MSEINIAKILKEKQKGTRLYSSVVGACILDEVEDSKITVKNNVSFTTFTRDGRFVDIPDGECTLFPSKKMRDWNKFTWKKGDILINQSDNMECIFKEYIDDTYEAFIGVHCINSGLCDDEYISETMFYTDAFRLQDSKLIPCYINTIEERFNGKLSKETLRIEPIKPNKPINSLKPFDRVVVREYNHDLWGCDFFSHMDGDNYICTSGYSWFQCLPYNEETAKLIGTKKSLKDIE